MNKALLDQLSKITKEEQDILNGKGVNFSHYSIKKNNVFHYKKILGKENQISIRPHTRFAHFTSHKHDFVEIMYVCQGEIAHVVDNKKIILKEGELLFLGKNTLHEILPVGENDICINFIVNPSFFRTAFDMMDKQNFLSDYIINCLVGDGDANEYIHFAVSQLLPVQNLVENMVYSLFKDNVDNKINEITMGLLLLHLIQIQDVSINTSDPRTIAVKAIQYIENNFQKATLREFCEQNNIAEYTASRIIKSEFKITFRHLLMEQRFLIATQMLKSSTLSVNDIIAFVGYENTSYFFRQFNTMYKCTPQQFRKKHNNK